MALNYVQHFLFTRFIQKKVLYKKVISIDLHKCSTTNTT